MQNLWDQFKQRVTGNQLVRFGVSLLLAVLLWGWVTQQQDPVESRSYTELAIEEPDLSGTIEIVTSLPRVTVSVSDVASQVEGLDRSNITVSLDVSEIDGPGTFEAPVEVSTEGELREISVSPDTISVQVEEEVGEVFPLIVEHQQVAGDATWVVDITPAVSQVTVRGTQSTVDRVERVTLPVSTEGQTSDFIMVFEPTAVGEDGQRVQEVTIEPDQVRTNVEMETRGKTVSVVPQVQGLPAEGYVLQQTVALPSTVILDGPDEALDPILFVDTQPVDIAGATESISQEVSLEPLPEGVTLVEPATNEVEVRVAIGTSAGTPNVIQGMPVEVRNLGDGFQVNVDPASVELSVSASADILSSLTPDDIDVFVDITGLGPGVYSLRPEVTLPPEISATVLNPQSVTVLISAEATPTGSRDPVDRR